jgi:hypothetical protein
MRLDFSTGLFPRSKSGLEELPGSSGFNRSPQVGHFAWLASILFLHFGQHSSANLHSIPYKEYYYICEGRQILLIISFD